MKNSNSNFWTLLVAVLMFGHCSSADAQRRLSLSDRVTALEAKLASAGQNEDRQTLTDLVFRLGELEEEVRMLRGQIETQAFEIENQRKGEIDRFNDLDRRLTELTQQQRTVTPGFAAGPEPLVPDGGDPSRVPAPSPGSVTSPQVPTGNPATPVDAEAAYDNAFQSLKDGRYDESARLFGQFLSNHPQSNLADNAQYWLGESYYVTRNYKISQETFKELLALFPDSDKVPDARLKLGFSQLALKQYPQARDTLASVSRDYAGTPVARLAENRLRTMRIEGHIQ